MASPPVTRPLIVVEAFARHLPSGAARTPLFQAWCALVTHVLPTIGTAHDLLLVTDSRDLAASAPDVPAILDDVKQARYAAGKRAAGRAAILVRTCGSAFALASLGPGETLTPAPGLTSGAGLAILEAAVLSRVSGYSPLASPGTMASILRVFDALTDRNQELVVAGALPLDVWKTLEDETACRVRVLGDLPRPGPAGPWHATAAAVSSPELVGWIATLGDAAVIDARLLAPEPLHPDDLFWAGLGRADRVREPALAALIREAEARGVPVLLGSDSWLQHEILGMVALAWKRRDVPRPAQMAVATP
jgi:hypothetical protein